MEFKGAEFGANLYKSNDDEYIFEVSDIDCYSLTKSDVTKSNLVTVQTENGVDNCFYVQIKLTRDELIRFTRGFARIINAKENDSRMPYTEIYCENETKCLEIKPSSNLYDCDIEVAAMDDNGYWIATSLTTQDDYDETTYKQIRNYYSGLLRNFKIKSTIIDNMNVVLYDCERLSRHGLRPVDVKNDVTDNIQKGYFHQYINGKSSAIVELEDGNMIICEICDMKFVDNYTI